MMSTQPERALCEHRVLEGAIVIHEFILREGTRPAINAMFDKIEEILASVPAPATLPCLIDASHGIYAVAVAFTRIRGLVQKFPGRQPGRIALLMPDTSLLRVIDTIMRPFGSVRMFRPHERAEALEWLREA